MPQGVVTEHLIQLIAKQVDERGLVVWYDPDQAYGSVVAELALPNTTVACFDDSFFKLRKEIDHLMNDGQPPRLVVYVPIEREKTHAALIELEAAGVVMQPRQQPPACNALKPILGEDLAGKIERQAEAGKLSLADLNSLADVGQPFDTTDFHVEAIDLLSNRVPCEAGITLVVAVYSAIKRQSVLAGLVILGDLSIQGNLKALRTLAEPLQVSMDNGAHRALVPLENKRNFLEVSGDIVERVDPVFFSDPMTAAMKALGMN